MTALHIGEFIKLILFGKFFNLFFHWSFEVRDKFFYFILYIIGYKLKNIVPFQDLEDVRNQKKSNLNEVTGTDLHKSLGEILEDKLKIIKELQSIILVQNYDISYNNMINPIKYSKILSQIPEEVHKNIVISISHFNKINQEYKTFIDLNKGKIKKDIEYPILELTLPRDD